MCHPFFSSSSLVSLPNIKKKTVRSQAPKVFTRTFFISHAKNTALSGNVQIMV